MVTYVGIFGIFGFLIDGKALLIAKAVMLTAVANATADATEPNIMPTVSSKK